MLPKNPLLQLVLPRAQSALHRIREQIWTERSRPTVRFGGAFAEPISERAAEGLEYREIAIPFAWGKVFDQAWFEIEWTGGETAQFLRWHEQGEATLYLDGVPYYGFDVAHRYCPLPTGGGRGRVESLCLQSAIWHPEAKGLSLEGSRIEAVTICERNEAAWAASHDLAVLFDLALEEHRKCRPLEHLKLKGVGYQPPVENVPVLYRRLLRALDDAVNALDRDGIEAMRDSLAQTYAALEGRHEMVRGVLTGHAHIDLVWLWPERVGEYKAVHTFATVNRTMEHYPEFRFAYSQPASYAAVRERSPAMWDIVQRRVRSGSWEPQGALEVESDTLLACGEALLRSFVVGQRRFEEMFGQPSTVLWLPDVFGYSGCLPQMAVENGATHFFTTKLTWSNVNQFPYSSFRWTGIDGSTLLTHVTQENGYVQAAHVSEISRGASAHRQSDLHDEFLAPTGYGDGGGGPTEEMCERVRRMRSLAGLPEVGWGRLDEFFGRMESIADNLPEYRGELYLEYHRGTATTHSDLKLRFRELERALQTWEAARVASGGPPIDERYWQRLIMAQFHDYIPGSSIAEVYEEGLPELKKLASEALAEAEKDLGGSGSHVFNPLPFARTVLVDSNEGEDRIALELPALGTASMQDAQTPSVPVSISDRRFSSGRVSVAVGSDGTLRNLEFDGHAMMHDVGLGQLWIYPDYPHNFDAWDIDRQTLSLGSPVETPVEWLDGRSTPNEASIRFRRRIGAASTVTATVSVNAFDPVVFVDLDLDWREENALLKVLFPTNYLGRMARFGAPYGSVLRSQHAGQPRDEAMFESCASRWVSVMHDDESDGLAVISEAKYGWSCRDGALGLSLIRSVAVTGEDAQHRRLIPPGLRRGEEHAKISDLGHHRIRFALARHHSGLSRAENPATLSDAIFTPPIRVAREARTAWLPGFRGMDSVVIAWVSPCDAGRFSVRLHETMGRAGTMEILAAPGTIVDVVTIGGEILSANARSVAIRGGQILSLDVRRGDQ